MSSATDNQVKVGIRIRPLLESEKANSANSSFNKSETTPIWCQQGKVTIGADSRSRSTFNFDWASDASIDTKSIYTNMCGDLIEKPYLGYNATFFAYGQTGSGKTFTMGNASDSIEGIIPFAVRDIYRLQQRYLAQGDQITVQMSYLEIYLEECFDLLSSSNHDKKKVEVRENQLGSVIVEGLTHRTITTEEQVKELIKTALKRRSTSKTAMNSDSSRSHAICTFTISRTTTSTLESTVLTGKLNLVDLAGSERASKTKAAGEILQEGININKGLLALSNVVSALSMLHKKDGNSTGIHIPYRESKLTRLLKDSLGGNGFTVLLACVSPAMSNCDETLNTLRFAARASTVTNTAKINLLQSSQETETAAVTAAITAQLKEQVLTLQQQNLLLRNTILDLQSHETDANEAQHETDSTYQIHCFTLVTSYKNLLLHCFNENIELDDSILTSIAEDLSTMSSSPAEMIDPNGSFCAEFEAEFGAETDMEMMKEFLPPIMQVLDLLSGLESRLKKDLHFKTNTDTSSLSMIEAVDDNDNSVDLPEQGQAQTSPAAVAKEEAIAAELESKLIQLENKDIHYQRVIQTLHKEIQLLQTENVAAAAVTLSATPSSTATPTPAATNTQQQQQLQHQLKLKSKQLEDKIKALRTKEQEYTQLITSKAQLHKQLDDQKLLIQHFKVDKVKLAQTLKEKSILYRNETKALQQSETRSKLQTQQAEAKIGKLGLQLERKEKTWQSRLESQQREKEKLVQLLSKRDSVKQQIQAKLHAKLQSKLHNKLPLLNRKNNELITLLDMQSKQATRKAELLYLQDTKKSWLDKRIHLRDELRSLRPTSRAAKKHEHMIKTCSNKVATLAKDILRLQLQAAESAATVVNTIAQVKQVLGDNVEESTKAFVVNLWSKYQQLQVDKHHLTLKLEHSPDDELDMLDSNEGDEHNDEGSQQQEMDETFYPSSEDDEEEEEDEQNIKRRKAAPAVATVVSKSRTSNESRGSNNTSTNDSDSNDEDEEDTSFESTSKKRGKNQQVSKLPANKRARKNDDLRDNSLPSIDNEDTTAAENSSKRRTNNNKAAPKFVFSDSPDNALAAYITSSQASTEDCLQDAMKLYQELPEGFIIATYTHTTSSDKMEIATSMAFKRAFPDTLKAKMNGSSIKRRDEQWIQMKNDLALLFTAFVRREIMVSTSSGNIVCVPLTVTGSTVTLEELQPFLENIVITNKATAKIEAAEKSRHEDVAESGGSSIVNWNKLTIKELKGFLVDRGLPVSGTKSVLVERLVQHDTMTFKPVVVASSLAMDVSEEDQEIADENKPPPAAAATAAVNMKQLKPRRSLKFDLDELMKDIDNNRTARQQQQQQEAAESDPDTMGE